MSIFHVPGTELGLHGITSFTASRRLTFTIFPTGKLRPGKMSRPAILLERERLQGDPRGSWTLSPPGWYLEPPACTSRRAGGPVTTPLLVPPLPNSVSVLAGNFLASQTWNGAAQSWARLAPSSTGSHRDKGFGLRAGPGASRGTATSRGYQAGTVGPRCPPSLSAAAEPHPRLLQAGASGGSREEHLPLLQALGPAGREGMPSAFCSPGSQRGSDAEGGGRSEGKANQPPESTELEGRARALQVTAQPSPPYLGPLSPGSPAALSCTPIPCSLPRCPPRSLLPQGLHLLFPLPSTNDHGKKSQ